MPEVRVPFAPHVIDVSDEEADALAAQGLVLTDEPAAPAKGGKPAKDGGQ